MPSVLKWKKYLSQQDLYSGDVFSPEMDNDFKRAMASFDSYITDQVPVVKGMIWNNDKIQTTVQDAKEAVHLLNLHKNGQATLDALGPPEDNRDTFFNQMFISQDDANSNEWDPAKNQNQGNWQNPAPQKERSVEDLFSKNTNNEDDEKQPETAENNHTKMIKLFDFLEFLKK